MAYFHYKNAEFYGENVKLADVAEQFGTPCYVYSKRALVSQWDAFEKAFGNVPHRICYAVKANSNIAILNLFAQKNAGFDIVSRGELERVLAARGDPKKIVFSGVGKQQDEIERALEVGVGCFNVESEAELERLQKIGVKKNKIVPIALRINPDIDPKTHPYIATGLSSNKFGIEYQAALLLCKKIKTFSHIKMIGIACHIGSQLTEISPFMEACERLLHLVAHLKSLKIHLQHIDVGGGLGVVYQNEKPPSIAEYVTAIINKLSAHGLEIFIEPGRVLVANAGVLLTRVEYLKYSAHKNFAIIDAGMNDLMRPSLYDAWHEILPVLERSTEKKNYDIVGPVCESADFFGKNRALALAEQDLLAVMDVGAYGFSMSSNYNSRPRAAEVMIDQDQVFVIRERESFEELFKTENIL